MSKEEILSESDLPEGFGQDERSLVKIPFTTIGKTKKSKKPKELNAAWTARVQGKEKKFFKTVTGSGKYGLPEYPAEEVFIALLYQAARSGLTSREVTVVPSQLFKLMGWHRNGQSYKRLRRALHQLTTVYIHTNALWDSRATKFVEAGFGIVEEWRIEKGETAPLFGDDNSDLLHVVWSERLYEHFTTGRFKLLNVTQYYALKTPLARRLYRWADEALYPMGRVEIDVKHLAYNRLEISRSRKYVSSIMQSLTPALEELEAAGILTWSLEDSKTPSGKKLVFVRKAMEEPKQLELGEVPDQAGVDGRAAQDAAELEELLGTLSEEERDELLSDAVGCLDPFNKQIWFEKGKAAIGTRQLVRENMLKILRERQQKPVPAE